MSKHSQELIKSVQQAREKGASISELMQRYNLAKTTVWHHVQAIKLPPHLQRRLRSRQKTSLERKEVSWKRAREQALSILQNVDVEAAWPVLLGALYWSEGTKGAFVFTNTDTAMLMVVLKVLREKFGVLDSELQVLVRTSGSLDAARCCRYWSRILNVPLSEIRSSHNFMSSRGKSEYGVCRITLRKGGDRLKIVHCLIQEIAATMLQLESPHSSTDRAPHS